MPKIGELVDLVVFRFCLKVSPMLVKLSEKTDRTAWTVDRLAYRGQLGAQR